VKPAPRYIFPREHGSWGMLLFPLISAAILAKSWTWMLIPAFGAAMAGFLIREPLSVLLRQRYVWKQHRPETDAAKRSLWLFVPIFLASGLALLTTVPLVWLAALALIGSGLTAAYLYAALHNLQRSTLLQLAGSFGLASAAALPWLAAGRPVDRTLLLLMLVHAVHSTGGVLTVHARLEAMMAHRGKADSRKERTAAWIWQVVQSAVAVSGIGPLLAMALVIPLVLHVIDLLRLFCGDFVEVKSMVSTAYWKIDVEDNVFALLRDTQGRTAMLHSTSTQWKHRFNLEIFMSEGYLSVNGILSSTRSYGDETITVARRRFDEGFAMGKPREEIIYFDTDPSWELEVADFIRHIREDTPIESGTSEQALKAMKLVFSIYDNDPRGSSS